MRTIRLHRAEVRDLVKQCSQRVLKDTAASLDVAQKFFEVLGVEALAKQRRLVSGRRQFR